MTNGEMIATFDRVGAFRLNSGSRDAAVLVALAPGAYTAEVTANGNGITLVEVYDASTGVQLETEQLVNISTRGFVDTDDGVLVAGFVVTGTNPKRVLIRGIGPGLTAFGVPNVVANPVLKLYVSPNAATPIAQNDNWGTPQPVTGGTTRATTVEVTAAAVATGAFPLRERQQGCRDRRHPKSRQLQRRDQRRWQHHRRRPRGGLRNPVRASTRCHVISDIGLRTIRGCVPTTHAIRPVKRSIKSATPVI